MTRELFDDLIGDPPPSTVDVAAIVRREKRRHWFPAGAAAAAIAVLVAVAAAVSGGEPTPQRAGGPPGAPPYTAVGPTTTVPDAPGFRLVVDTAEGTEATKKRLLAALNAAITRAAPQAGWDNGKPLGLHADPDGRPLFGGSGRLHNQGRRGVLLFSIGDLRPAPCRTGETEWACAQRRKLESGWQDYRLGCAEEPNCTVGTGPNGRRLITQRMTAPAGDDPFPQNTVQVRVELDGGYLLEIEAMNFTGLGVHQAEPVLDAEQVTSIATDLAKQIRK